MEDITIEENDITIEEKDMKVEKKVYLTAYQRLCEGLRESYARSDMLMYKCDEAIVIMKTQIDDCTRLKK